MASMATVWRRPACLRPSPNWSKTYGEDAVAKFVEGLPVRVRNGEFSTALAKQ